MQEISSTVFVDIRPRDLMRLKKLVEEDGMGKSLYLKSELGLINNSQAYQLLKAADEILQKRGSERYTRYRILYDFIPQERWSNEDKRLVAMPPGMVRVFSKNLICFYNGREWESLFPSVKARKEHKV